MYLNERERFAIWGLVKAGFTVRAIAREIGRSPSTVSRELRKGECECYVPGKGKMLAYDPSYAQLITKRRAAKKGPKPKIGNDLQTARAIDEQIIEHRRSPYSAVEICRKNGTLLTEISYKTVYNYVKSGLLMATSRDLPRGLRPRKKSSDFQSREQPVRRFGKSIEERPRNVMSRQEFGHWEGDLIVGAKGGKEAVLTLLERKTRFLVGIKIPSKHTESVVNALSVIERVLEGKMKDVFLSITFDNGSEFSDSEGMMASSLSQGEKRIGEIYYAHPYCSSERASNECANGFLRRRHPKGTHFEDISQDEIRDSVRWVNSCPRRLLGGMTAEEAFKECVAKIKAA